MNHAEFEALVHDCLDRRQDPLDEPRVTAHLEAHPDAIEAFAAQRALVAALPHAAPVPAGRARSRRWPWLLAVAAAVVLAAVLLSPSRSPAPAAPAQFRVLASSLTEQTATCGATLPWRTHELLLQTPTTRLEVVEQGSVRP